MAAHTYERVTYLPLDARRSRTIYLRNPYEVQLLGMPVLCGDEVNREADEVAPRGVDTRRHMIDCTLVRRRTPVRLDRHYGVLLAEGEEA
jgi:hypothetical protein